MRKTLIAASLLSLFAAAPVLAEDKPAADYTLTGNVSIASEYIYRGIGQTNRKPAIQGGFDYAHNSGLYLGTWASNISWLSDASTDAAKINAPMEWDFYGGYKFNAGPVGMDVGGLYYYYPGSYPAGFTSPDTTEIYAAGTWKWFTLKYSYSLSNLFGAKSPAGDDTKGSGYLDLTSNFDLGGGFGLVAHVGHQDVAHFSDASYTDWKLGVTKDFFGLSWGLSYIDTNAKGDTGQFYHNAYDKDLGKAAFVLSVSKSL